MKSPHRIVFIHSLNNFTGSPNVLSVVIKGFLRGGYRAELITSRGDGFLSDLPGLRYRYTCYRWSQNQIVTLALLLLSQFGLFFRLLFYSRKHTYYINSIVPFGAILACWLTRKRFVIHVHENMQQRKPIYRIFRLVYSCCNKKSIFVSHYLRQTALRCRDSRVIYNALPQAFFRRAASYLQEAHPEGHTILMVASLRRFKGVYELVELARTMPQHQFELVLSSDESAVEQFRNEIGNIPNLAIYPLQTDLHPFYQRAKLLLQLSHPEAWVETFGLTILEALVYGVPAIVPPVGGPVELIQQGVNGFAVNAHEVTTLRDRIEQLTTNPKQYLQFSKAARLKSQEFEETIMINKIEEYIR